MNHIDISLNLLLEDEKYIYSSSYRHDVVMEFIKENQDKLEPRHLLKCLDTSKIIYTQYDLDFLTNLLKSKHHKDLNEVINAIYESHNIDNSHIFDLIVNYDCTQLLTKDQLLDMCKSCDPYDLGIVIDNAVHCDDIMLSLLKNKNIDENHVESIVTCSYSKKVLQQAFNHPLFNIDMINCVAYRFLNFDLFPLFQKINNRHFKSTLLE